MRFAEFFKHFGGAETYGIHVNINGSFYSSSTAFLHSPPILKIICYQRIGRDGGYGSVPVLHFNGGE